jgi:N-methylhydantoinase B/oxoprolinase/acetone carboxylase alpha subunit
MRGYPVFRVPTEAPEPTSREATNPQVGPIFRCPARLLIFLLGSRRRAHHQREKIDGGPPGGAEAEGPEAPTTNMKTSTVGPREVPELKVWDRHHQCENVDGGPPGGAEAKGPGASTTNVKTSAASPREVTEVNQEVPELKVRERPPPTGKRRRRVPGRCRS